MSWIAEYDIKDGELVCTWRHAKDRNAVRAENTKLRELCRMFVEYVSQDRCEGCVFKGRCNNGEVEECWQLTEILKLARELGIEVDE